MDSKVFFHNARASANHSRIRKVKELFYKAGLEKLIKEGDQVAIKVHWGEPGNVAFLPPPYVGAVVELVKKSGGLPYVTDTNTLYTGMRRNAVQNILAAAQNGFTTLSVGAPVIVADGISGRDFREIELPDSTVGKAKIASGILDADAMIVLSHVKGHMLFGFGGAIKNLGMGCAAPGGKQILHSDLRPSVDQAKCTGDGICAKRCPQQCIELIDRPKGSRGRRMAQIDDSRCIGCGECTAACPHEAIPIRWTTSADAIQIKTAEYALAAIKDKPGKVGYINFLIQITPDCDCCDWNDNPFVPDLGFLASTDPVAIDVASTTLVREATPLPLSKAADCPGDPWRAVYDIDYGIIFKHAERIGLGKTKYQLVKL